MLTILLMLMLSEGPCQSASELVAMLKSEDWQKRDDAITRIRKEECGSNEEIRNTLLSLLSENLREGHEREANILAGASLEPREGYGEYTLNLISLVADLEIKGAGPLLLDAIQTGGRLPEALASILAKDTEESGEVWELLNHRFYSNASFDRSRRTGYVLVLAKYVGREEQIEPERKARLTQMVLDALADDQYAVQSAAVKASRYLLNDPLVRHRLGQIVQMGALPGSPDSARRLAKNAKSALEATEPIQ